MYSDKFIKSKQRVRDAGEVFTPPDLVEEMLDAFPKDAWSRDKNWLEPTCGNGNFIVAIITRKLKKNFTLIEALNTTFGMDIMEDNVIECRQRIYHDIVLHKSNRKYWPTIVGIVSHNIIQANSLPEDWNNKFLSYSSLSDHEITKIEERAERALVKIVDAEKIVDADIMQKNKRTYYKSLLALRKDFI